jgi:hypothetical protein
MFFHLNSVSTHCQIEAHYRVFRIPEIALSRGVREGPHLP